MYAYPKKNSDQCDNWLWKIWGVESGKIHNFFTVLDFFKKMELKGEELPAWMISLDDIKQEMEAMDDAVYEAKTKDADSDNEDDQLIDEMMGVLTENLVGANAIVLLINGEEERFDYAFQQISDL